MNYLKDVTNSDFTVSHKFETPFVVVSHKFKTLFVAVSHKFWGGAKIEFFFGFSKSLAENLIPNLTNVRFQDEFALFFAKASHKFRVRFSLFPGQ